MTQHLGDLLSNKAFQEPPEIKQIKEFVKAELNIEPRVSITQNLLIVQVSSAAAAGVLRTKLPALQTLLATKQRIVIRIG